MYPVNDEVGCDIAKAWLSRVVQPIAPVRELLLDLSLRKSSREMSLPTEQRPISKTHQMGAKRAKRLWFPFLPFGRNDGCTHELHKSHQSQPPLHRQEYTDCRTFARSSRKDCGKLAQGRNTIASAKSVMSTCDRAKALIRPVSPFPPPVFEGKRVGCPYSAENLRSRASAMRLLSQYMSRPIARSGMRR